MLNYIKKLIEIKSITKLIIIFNFFIENNINICYHNLVIKIFSIKLSLYIRCIVFAINTIMLKYIKKLIEFKSITKLIIIFNFFS